MAKNSGNHGSKKPLERGTGVVSKPATIKKSAFEDEVYRRSLQGTPPTRRGAFNGVLPSLKPNIPADLNPPLVINKALIVAPKPGVPEGSRAQVARKRDDHGKFVESGSQGQETSADQDSDDAERRERLAAARMRDRLNPDSPRRPSEQRRVAQKAFGQPEPNPFQQAKQPQQSQQPQFGTDPQAQSASNTLDTSPPADAGFGSPDQMTEGSPGQVMGNTMSGMPIFDDPFHPGHEGFSADDHMSAAQLHEQAAQEAEMAGDYIQSAIAKLRASVHTGLSQDAQSPMDRFAQQSAGSTQDPMAQDSMAGGQDPMNSFGGGDQQKPIFQNQQANQGPLPGMMNTQTQSPIGMQSQPSPYGEPQQMPPSPSAQNGSMPELGEDQGTQSFSDQDQDMDQDVSDDDSYDFGGGDDEEAEDTKKETAPFGNDTDEKKDEEKGKDSTTKSLRLWLEKHK